MCQSAGYRGATAKHLPRATSPTMTTFMVILHRLRERFCEICHKGISPLGVTSDTAHDTPATVIRHRPSWHCRKSLSTSGLNPYRMIIACRKPSLGQNGRTMVPCTVEPENSISIECAGAFANRPQLCGYMENRPHPLWFIGTDGRRARPRFAGHVINRSVHRIAFTNER